MTALLLFGVIVLVLINGFFVAAEFSLVRARRSRMEQLATEGQAGAKAVLESTRDVYQLNQYLSACQLGITLASIGIGFLGEPAIASILEPLFGDVVSHGLAVALSIGIAYAIVTSLHVIAGELMPKFVAIAKAEEVALKVARPLHIFTVAFKPIISGLNLPANGILHLFGFQPSTKDEYVTTEDLKLLIGESLRGGELEVSEAGMLSGVFHLHEQQARQVMTPIPAVVTVDIADQVENALRRCVSSGHTRMVVIEDDNPDRVKGLVHSNALAERLMTEGPHASLAPIVYDAPIIPEGKPLDDLLADLQRQRSSMAIVVDEYGRTAGVVTIEDIIEEVVGEIDDETDTAAAEVRKLPNGDWFVRGHVALTDLPDYGLDLPAEAEAYNSVGGLVFTELGRLPKRGDAVMVDGFQIRVESVRENRIEAVRISERRPS